MNQTTNKNKPRRKSHEEIIKVLEEENKHMKNVLLQTESMLQRLQTGVDAEVQKWQEKVSSKDKKLQKVKKSYEELIEVLLKYGYDAYDLDKLEISLINEQKQSMAEKEEVAGLKNELTVSTQTNEELSRKVKELSKTIRMKKAIKGDEATLMEKFKRTISERDLLIREYKLLKDKITKIEAGLNNCEMVNDKSFRDIAVLKELEEEVKRLTKTKKKLEDDASCVIVDLEPDDSYDLRIQAETLATHIATGNRMKTAVADTKKYYADSTDSLEDKLKFAELRILELEANLSNKQNGGD